MHQNRFLQSPRPSWGSLRRSPDPLAGFERSCTSKRGKERERSGGKNPTSKEGIGRKGKEGNGLTSKGGKGREREEWGKGLAPQKKIFSAATDVITKL